MPRTPQELLRHLDDIGVAYRLYEHEAVFTCEQSAGICAHIPGTHCKNLFLKDKKDALWLVTAPDAVAVDLKALPEKTGCKRLSFGSGDLLMEILGVPAGSVTPFALMNDAQRRVQPVLDAGMMTAPLVNLHPLVNTATITVAPEGVLRFLRGLGYEPLIAGL